MPLLCGICGADYQPGKLPRQLDAPDAGVFVIGDHCSAAFGLGAIHANVGVPVSNIHSVVPWTSSVLFQFRTDFVKAMAFDVVRIGPEGNTAILDGRF